MTLAERAASAKPEETAGLLEELRIAANQITPPYWHTMRGINTPESLLAAAMMLIPEDHPKWAVTGRNSATIGRKVSEDANVSALDWVFAATPALAMIAAIAQSKGL